MRYKIATYTACAALLGSSAFAQPPRTGIGGPGRGPDLARMLPVYAALDANGDGEISAEEIAGATTALQKLDKNGDGSLSEDEIAPTGFGPPGGMRGGFGRRGASDSPDSDGSKQSGDGRSAGDRADGPPRGGRAGFGPPGGIGDGGRGRGGRPGGRPDRGPGAAGGSGRGGAPADPQATVERLMTLDTDEDSKLTRDEVDQRFHSLFTRADKNTDDVITREELKQMLTK